MSLQITGKFIADGGVQVVSDKFKKREFVLELAEEINGNTYTNFAKFQLVQNKCDILDKFNAYDMLTVHFNIKGNKWEKDGKVNYISNLDAWKIEIAADAPAQAAPNRPAGFGFSGNGQAPQQQAAAPTVQGFQAQAPAAAPGFGGFTPAQNNPSANTGAGYTAPSNLDDLPF